MARCWCICASTTSVLVMVHVSWHIRLLSSRWTTGPRLVIEGVLILESLAAGTVTGYRRLLLRLSLVWVDLTVLFRRVAITLTSGAFISWLRPLTGFTRGYLVLSLVHRAWLLLAWVVVDHRLVSDCTNTASIDGWLQVGTGVVLSVLVDPIALRREHIVALLPLTRCLSITSFTSRRSLLVDVYIRCSKEVYVVMILRLGDIHISMSLLLLGTMIVALSMLETSVICVFFGRAKLFLAKTLLLLLSIVCTCCWGNQALGLLQALVDWGVVHLALPYRIIDLR